MKLPQLQVQRPVIWLQVTQKLKQLQVPVLIELIKTTKQPEILNVRLVLNEEEAHDSDGSNNESNSSESDSE